MSGTYKKIVAHKYSKNFREASEIVSTDIVQPGPGQLLIKTHFGGVNASDEYQRRCLFFRWQLPL